MKMAVPEKETIEKHYLVDPEWKVNVGKKQCKAKGNETDDIKELEKAGDIVLGNLKNFMTSGPVIAMIIEGAHAIELVRKLVGGTEPLSSDVGTIRGDYVIDSYEMADGSDRCIRNLIHASSSTEDAKKEISVWFSDKDIIDYQTSQEKILYGDWC